MRKLLALLLLIATPALALDVKLKAGTTATFTTATDMKYSYLPPDNCAVSVAATGARSFTLTAGSTPCAGSILMTFTSDLDGDGTPERLRSIINLEITKEDNDHDATLGLAVVGDDPPASTCSDADPAAPLVGSKVYCKIIDTNADGTLDRAGTFSIDSTSTVTNVGFLSPAVTYLDMQDYDIKWHLNALDVDGTERNFGFETAVEDLDGNGTATDAMLRFKAFDTPIHGGLDMNRLPLRVSTLYNDNIEGPIKLAIHHGIVSFPTADATFTFDVGYAFMASAYLDMVSGVGLDAEADGTLDGSLDPVSVDVDGDDTFDDIQLRLTHGSDVRTVAAIAPGTADRGHVFWSSATESGNTVCARAGLKCKEVGVQSTLTVATVAVPILDFTVSCATSNSADFEAWCY